MADDSAPIRRKPRVFVITPMGDLFDGLYTLWREKLQRYCHVTRADTTPNQRNIVSDIMQGISHSDLIIAELTGLNANVLYELGVAHALDKPVILLSQEKPESLPFDLKAYRVLSYSPDISGAIRAGDLLIEHIRQFIAGDLEFGSPVSDHLKRSVDTWSIRDEKEDGEAGLLDYMFEVETGYKDLTRVMESLTEDMSRQGEVASDSTSRLESSTSTIGRRNVIQAFARSAIAHSGHLRKSADDLRPLIASLGTSLELTLQHIDQMATDDLSSAREFEHTLEEFDSQVEYALSAMSGYRKTWQDMPQVERNLNRARHQVIRSVSVLCDVFEDLQKSNARSRRTLRQKIEAIDD